MAAAGSLVAAVAFAPIPIGYLLAAPGRGSETVILANILGPALLAIAFGLGTQASGFLVFLRDPLVSRAAAVALIGDALAVAVLGLILLADRFPCYEGLYCSGQVLGSLGRLTIYIWFPVLGIGYLFAGALALPESAIRRSLPFAGGTLLLTVEGLVLLAFFASLFHPLGALAHALFLLSLGLGAAANVLIAAAFFGEARAASATARPS
jgi:hypothetical protein